MDEEAPRSRSGLLLLSAGFFMVILAVVFAFVPLVECRRCDKEGQFAVKDGTRVLGFDYCDCASFFLLWRNGTRGRITLLKALRKPQPLIVDYNGTGKGFKP